MVKVNGPAMSMDASGSLGGAIVFSKWKGRNYIRQLVKPANPKSALQVSMRAMMRFLSQLWASLSAEQQATWETLAAQKVVSPFNAFVSRNQKRWRTFQMPGMEDPIGETGTQSTIASWAAAGGVREITLSGTVSTIANGMGLAIFRSTSGTFTESLSNCIAVIPALTEAAFSFVDGPLTPGTYYYSYIPFTTDGKTGTPSAEVNATCT
jgi:hypothetical protein